MAVVLIAHQDEHNKTKKGSPAFEADILNGDVLRQIGDVSVFDDDSYQKAMTKYEGREADVVIVRGDNEFHKTVKLGTQN